MNCQQFEHFIDDYLDGELAGTMKLEFEAHVVECETCGHMLATMESFGNILSQDEPNEPTLSDDFADRVIADYADSHNRRQLWYRLLSKTAAAAALILVVWSVIWSSTGTTYVASRSLEPEFNAPNPIDLALPAESTVLASRTEPSPERGGTTASDLLAAEMDIMDMETHGRTIVPAGTLETPVTTDSSNAKAQLELRQWVALTMEEVGQTFYQLHQLSTVASDHMREVLMGTLSDGSMLQEPVMPIQIQPTWDMDTSPMQAEPIPMDGDIELI